MSAVRVTQLIAGYPGQPAVLNGVSLDVEPGATVAILGPSGGGKSTLLKVIAGLLPAASGQVEVLGSAPLDAPRGAVGYVPQRLGLVRHATALENVQQGALHETPTWRSLIGNPGPEIRDRALAALDAVGIADKAHQRVLNLSGGQQRRVAVARALVQRPRLLLADEFLGELDPDTVETVLDAVRALRRDHKTTTILVEHHLEQALRLADRVLRMKAGTLEELDQSEGSL